MHFRTLNKKIIELYKLIENKNNLIKNVICEE